MTFGWQLYYRNRPQCDIPGVSGKVLDAAIPVVHALQPELFPPEHIGPSGDFWTFLEPSCTSYSYRLGGLDKIFSISNTLRQLFGFLGAAPIMKPL